MNTHFWIVTREEQIYEHNDKSGSNRFTLSGVDAPEVTPIVMGPFGRKFSFSTNSPCCLQEYKKVRKGIRSSKLVAKS